MKVQEKLKEQCRQVKKIRNSRMKMKNIDIIIKVYDIKQELHMIFDSTGHSSLDELSLVTLNVFSQWSESSTHSEMSAVESW